MKNKQKTLDTSNRYKNHFALFNRYEKLHYKESIKNKV